MTATVSVSKFIDKRFMLTLKLFIQRIKERVKTKLHRNESSTKGKFKKKLNKLDN